MAKEAYYFSHDSNARNDPKIIKLRIKFGWSGYGLFWSLIELLRDQSEYVMQLDYESIAFALQSDSETIKSIINDFGLFEIEDDNFYSKSLLNRMKIKEEKSNKARKAALERWNKDKDANPMQTHSKSNANAMQGKESKGKEIKVNEIKSNSIYTVENAFELFNKAGLKGRYFSKMNQIHSINETVIVQEFEKWKILNDSVNFESEKHLENSFNAYLSKYKPQKQKTPTKKTGSVFDEITENDLK